MRRILLTRPRKRSEALAAELQSEGWTTSIWPVLEIEYEPPQPAALRDAGTLIFTSAAAVDALASLAPLKKPAIVVGPATARAAAEAGCAPVTTAAGDGEAILRLISERGVAAPALHIRGEDIRVKIADRIRAMGVQADDLIVYRAKAAAAAPPDIGRILQNAGFAAAAFYSPRSAQAFATAMTAELKRGLTKTRAIAISEATAEPLKRLGFAEIEIAKHPNGDAMRAAICGAAK